MGVSGDVVSREVVMLINRWWQPYSFAGATQGPALMGRGWGIQAGQGPSKKGSVSPVPAELRANQETKARTQWANLEGIQKSGHTGTPLPGTPAPGLRQHRDFQCETLSTQLALPHPSLITLSVCSSGLSW